MSRTCGTTGKSDLPVKRMRFRNLQKMLDMFEDNEDVQNVWHNWEE